MKVPYSKGEYLIELKTKTIYIITNSNYTRDGKLIRLSIKSIYPNSYKTQYSLYPCDLHLFEKIAQTDTISLLYENKKC